MSNTVSAKRIHEALAKARNIGISEESFTIEDCALVLRSLRHEEYGLITKECQDKGDLAMLDGTYEKGHLAHGIVEINGIDLRSTDFVEVEEDDPKTGTPKVVKLEKVEYLRKYVLSTWSREAVHIAFRKLSDVVDAAEKKAKSGIVFNAEDETTEDKFRRLIGEMHEIQEEIPPSLVDRILEEHGLMLKSTAEDIKVAMEKADELAREKEEAEKALEDPAEPIVPRQPMNRGVVSLPPDPHQNIIPQTPIQAVPQRLKDIAALEEAVMPVASQTLPVAPAAAQQGDPVELVKAQQKVDPKALVSALDQPPRSGINPRFKPQSR